MKSHNSKLVCLFFTLFLLGTANATSLTESLVILRGDDNYPPDEMVVDGKLTGFHIELIEAVAKQTDIDVRFESVPWKRAQQMIKNGQGDAISYISKNNERSDYAIFLKRNLLSCTDHFLVYHPNHAPGFAFQGQLSDLAGHAIGVQHGYSYGQQFDDAQHIKKIVFKNYRHMTELLENGRIDLALINPVDYQNLIQQPNFSELAVLDVPLTTTKNFLAFSKAKKHQKLAEKFARAMSDFRQTEKYRQLVRKYNKSFVSMP
ncbi:ABC transporter substrate-binding protein [Bacterioplanoides sp. SCSIO 12839]|uniref:substrate-binding periplasmic protein n=1 Tax=Bacterioplanoides sp. SCSIO 12839 TaxID=2829569 RepID=UPI00210832A8|nr:transporter substrate-binding domain-containing protein [Bacterioplanoides sp. SCSIO 12839]UTW47935.1 amino acid ABC transporter substrate-binding protein [Bacterioplanoides sp. SCSIO 12839]